MKHLVFWTSVIAVAGVGFGCCRPDETALSQAVTNYESAASSPLLAIHRAARPADSVRSDAMEDQPGWLEMGPRLARSEAEPAREAAPTPPPAHWTQRRGPAYSEDILRTIGLDAKELPATLWDDTKATATDPLVLIGIALAGASGIAINASGSDDQVADHFSKHGSQLNTFWDGVGDVGGNPGTHFAVAGAMYLVSLAREDTKNYEISKTLINALAINGVTTLALKGVVRTRSPNGDPCGWPSGHTSSTFCLATVMHEQYGPVVGVPLFAFAAFVGYERIDARNHDFSDVVSGALLGMAIGHAVSQNHDARILGMEIVPTVDPARNTMGVALLKKY